MKLHTSVTHWKIKQSFETIESKFNQVHNNKYSYEKALFKGVDHKLIVTCLKHGDWEILPTNHLSGNGCLECYKESLPKTNEQFISEAKEVHGEKFNYSEVNYTNTHNKIKLTCNKCEYSFEQNAKSHINGAGCPSCSKNQRYTTEEYIKKSKVVHSNYYTYENAKYTTAHSMITITCPVHGDFEQTAASHMHGAGCFNCKPGGFDKTKPGRLYYLQVDINGVRHYKIGITNGTIKSRFRGTLDRSRITILKQKVYENGQDAINWENFFKARYKEYQYQGQKFFTNSGETEVFTIDILELFYKEKANNEIDIKTIPNGSSSTSTIESN